MTLIRILASLFWLQPSLAAEPEKVQQTISDKEFLYFLAYSIKQGDEIIDPLSIAEQHENTNRKKLATEATEESKNDE